MIRLIRHGETKERHGAFHWSVPELGLMGASTSPLTDACREIMRVRPDLAGEMLVQFREGRDAWDIRCGVAWGASRMRSGKVADDVEVAA
jgi:hypothetical protein